MNSATSINLFCKSGWDSTANTGENELFMETSTVRQERQALADGKLPKMPGVINLSLQRHLLS